jgi:diaminohydroxyphosphoribosylaminopyrimidine deaminase/5-amino-6-(5-phosphoribosylamino)uracil reductase
VSLEPCSHYGKTPPCCDLIIRNEIQNIVVGTVDPNEKVAGNGIRKLEEAGKNVTVGVLEAGCREFNRRFFTFHEKQRPYIILKWAESADGFLSPEHKDEQKPVWITNAYSRQLVHKWRSEEMAILVGTQTVLDDNPNLDVRSWTGQNPVRIVLDRTNRIPDNYSVKNHKIKTIILTETSNFSNLDTLLYESIAFDDKLPKTIAKVLFEHNLQSVIIEGGRQTLQTFIDANLWDEVRIFKGTATFEAGTPAPQFAAAPIHREMVLDDELLIYRNYGASNYI